jgi:four helix bundle protein
MATVRSFEELEVWKRARGLAKRIHTICKEGDIAKDYKLKDQMNGSSGSIMDNIAEGFERNGRREFFQFLSIAKGSAGELRSQIYRAFDRQYISEMVFQELVDETTGVSKLIARLMNYLHNTDYKGSKYKVEEPEVLYAKAVSDELELLDFKP